MIPNLHNNAMTILNSLKHLGQIVVDCGHSLNCSRIGLIGSGTLDVFVGIWGESGYH